MRKPRPVKISGCVRHYHWGKKGTDSLVARLINESEDKPYAELWFGTHSSAPSPLCDKQSDASNLRELVRKNPQEALGGDRAQEFNFELPFLMKILSISQPLSIQLHPDKATAAALRSSDSENYPDANHKPELAVAITETHLVHGFKSPAEISETLRNIPEISRLLPRIDTVDNSDSIRKLYLALLNSPAAQYSKAAQSYIERLENSRSREALENLVVKAYQLYGASDPAILTLPLMNYMVLAPGEGIFIAPNMLHAYVRGDIIECMANSDNVLRAGMTPKFKDISKLAKIVTFDNHAGTVISPEIMTGPAEVHRYPTPCSEFDLQLIKGKGDLDFSDGGATIFLCLEGRSSLSSGANSCDLSPGEGCFIPAQAGGVHVEIFSGVLARALNP